MVRKSLEGLAFLALSTMSVTAFAQETPVSYGCLLYTSDAADE